MLFSSDNLKIEINKLLFATICSILNRLMFFFYKSFLIINNSFVLPLTIYIFSHYLDDAKIYM